MLGVTGAHENRAKTRAWIESTGMEYAYAFFKDRTLSRATGHRAYPHAALIDAKGEIVWTGSPYSLSDSVVAGSLQGASKFLTYGWAEEFHGVAKELGAGRFDKALAAVDRLIAREVDGAREVRTAVLRALSGELLEMDEAFERGDYLAALQQAERLERNLDGLAHKGEVRTMLERLESDDAIQHVLAGQTKLARITGADLSKNRNRRKAIDQAEDLLQKYDGTIVAAEARRFILRMRAELGPNR